MRSRANTAGLVALSVASIAVSVVLVEVIFRITGLASPPAVISANEKQAASMPGVFVPRSTVMNRSVARFPHRITINSLGYRGADFPAVASAGETRVFVAGDSFTWGELVNDDETIPVQLEQSLAASCSDVRVINGGVGGTTIDAHREMIRRAMPLRPDIVVLVFYDNDIAEMAPPTFWEVMAANREAKSKFPLSVVYATLNRTATWVVLRRTAERLKALRSTAESPSERDESFFELAMEEHSALYAAQFRLLVAELREASIPLLLVRYPSHPTFIDPDIHYNHGAWLATLTAELGVPFLDLSTRLQASGLTLEQLYFIPWDGHARPVGNRMAGAAISETLLGFDAFRGCGSLASARAELSPFTPVNFWLSPSRQSLLPIEEPVPFSPPQTAN